MLIPVILSGGAGTRLWPLSREAHPKPFLKLPDGKTLLQKTYQRACCLANVQEILTITNKEYYAKSKPEYEAVTAASLPPIRFLLEPFSKNTAGAIALALLNVIANHGEEAILLVMPADHLIADTEAFKKACENAYHLAQQDHIVTFGITPTGAETGFGYIECGGKHAMPSVYQVNCFIEKPTIEKALAFFHCRRYLWNAGIFCFKAKAMLDAYQTYAPHIIEVARECWMSALPHPSDGNTYCFTETAFQHFENISIDYALLEKIKNIMVVTCEFEWQDIGSWTAYKQLYQVDGNGNAISGDAILIDSHNNFIHSEGRMVASIGLDNTVIIDTPDALLVSHQARTQEVRHVVKQLKERSHASYLNHVTVERPWGYYMVLEQAEKFKVKRIMVRPGASLSLQSHEHRSEHWVVVEGVAKIIKNNEEYLLHANQSLYVAKTERHRISNIGKAPLIIIEVQVGDYLEEDDIIRYDDVYGRA